MQEQKGIGKKYFAQGTELSDILEDDTGSADAHTTLKIGTHPNYGQTRTSQLPIYSQVDIMTVVSVS